MERAIFSLNTDKIGVVLGNEDAIKVNYELALRLARKQFGTVVLYTDDKGAGWLENFADEIQILLKKKDYIWSEAKFEAISREKGEFLHIDGDLFIPEKLKLQENADVFCDLREVGIWDKYYKHIVEMFDNESVHDIFPEWKNYEVGGGPCNIGILGFKDTEKRDLYLDRYYKLKDFYFSRFGGEGKLTGIPSMTIEQHSLACIAHEYSWEVDQVNKTNPYLHMWGIRKYHKMFQIMAKATLENERKGDIR